MKKYNDNEFIGIKYGKITIIKYLGKIKNNSNRRYWLGKCECGNTIKLCSSEIINRKRKQCHLCSKPTKIHGMTNTRLFNIWQSMKARCYNPNNSDYYNYGAKGTIVCKEWKNNFLNFYNWAINNGYNKNLTIDRINTYGSYEPNNCRWADNYTQANNKKRTIKILYKGNYYTITEISKITGIPRNVISARYYAKWNAEKIFNIPLNAPYISGKSRKIMCIETNKVYNSIVEASLNVKINSATIIVACKNPKRTAKGFHWKYI